MQIDRRRVMLLGGAGSLVVTQGEAAPLGAAAISDCRVCGLETPLALGAATPRFSWRLSGSRPQAAYRITVARSAADLSAPRDLVWDSGKVASGQSFDIAFDGPAAAPRQVFWWRVEAWDDKGARAVGRPARWETGLLSASDWNAAWLAAEDAAAKADRLAGVHWISGPESITDKTSKRCYRTSFEVPPQTDGTLFLAASGLAGVFLNGQELAAGEEEPTRFTTMSPYPLALQPGRNVIAIAQTPSRDLGGPQPMLCALIRLGGSERRLSTAEGWKTTVNAPEGWRLPDFDDGAWPAATTARNRPRGQPLPPGAAAHLRRAFRLDKPVAQARLYATALGAYEAWINGAPADERKMAPEPTNLLERVLYQAYDVTAALRAGENVLGLWVGDGWYASEFSANARFCFGPAPCRAMAQLEILFTDGTRQVIATDDQWRIAPSAILSSEIYDGEVYDARQEIKDWALPGTPRGDWRPAETVEAPNLPIDAQVSPPIRVTQRLKPKAVTSPKPGVHVFDFGQNFAGWAELAISGKAGTRIELLFGEYLKPDGQVDQANLRTAFARDTYVLKGQGREVWSPRFTYHGFRYVEVRGLANAPAADLLTGLVGHNDIRVSGVLRVGDPVVEQFWRNSVWSQRSNFFGLPTDCPQRDERLGWLGDAAVFWPAAAYNMDVEAFTHRFMGDVRRAQRPDGQFPDCIPPFMLPSSRSAPGWSDAGVILPYTVWRQYGDTGVIAENWEAMERYLAFILAKNPDHLWKSSKGNDYGDWLAVDAKYPGEATTPKDLIGTAFWAADAAMMRDMAKAIGKAEAAERYGALFEALRAAFAGAYVQADGKIGNGSQTSYILAIRFGLLSPEQANEAGRRLAADIAARGGKLSTGFLGTPHILDALADTGQEATAVGLLLQRDYPSWGYMVTKGATTMWERWNSDTGDLSMNSYNHYAFGAIGDFLFRRIAGLAAVEPGFAKVVIAPIFDRRLGSAGADYDSVSGRLTSNWRYEGDTVRLDLSIPPGVQAEVVIPTAAKAVRLDGRPAPSARFRVERGQHRVVFTA